MSQLSVVFKRREMYVYTVLCVCAALFFSYQITRPLTDYDEAIYANVVVDTLHNGGLMTLFHAGQPWFEKPPLYLWAAMSLVSAFGPQEWAFRLPGIAASVLCLILSYLIVRRLTGSISAATISFLILLTAPWFYFFAREVRLDSGVIAAILATLLVVLLGWKDERYLWFCFPLIAIGFLIKSIIVLLAIPVLLLYALAYREWNWVFSKKLWFGSLIGLAILLPWHVWESWNYGTAFWQSYLFSNLDRTTATLTGTYGLGDYAVPVMQHMPVWFWACAALAILYLIACSTPAWRHRLPILEITAPLASTAFIFVFFTLARTHLGAYVMPAYPFVAMFAAQFAHAAIQLGKKGYPALLLVLILISSGAYYCLTISWENFQDQGRFVNDELRIGRLYRSLSTSSPGVPLYAFQWGGLDTIDFYGGTEIRYIDGHGASPTVLKAPFFFVTTDEVAQVLYTQLPQTFDRMNVIYEGQYLVELYSDKDMTVGG